MDPLAAALLAALTAVGTTLGAAFFRGDLIPGHVYRREIKRADTATTQAERNALAAQENGKAIQEVVPLIREMAATIRAMAAKGTDAPRG